MMGYGFIEFDNHEEANAALKSLNGKPMPSAPNKVFKLNWASYQNKSNNNPNATEFSIYVCELDTSVNEDVLKSHFQQFYQSVISAKIIVDPSTKISKGYGFVKFSDNSEAQRAISEMNGKQINGKTMKVGQASFKKNANDKSKSNFKDSGMNHNNQGGQMKNDNMTQMQTGLNNQMFYNQDPNAVYNLQDPSMIQQQMYYYMANGYYPPNYLYYQMYPQYYQQQGMPQGTMPQQPQVPGPEGKK